MGMEQATREALELFVDKARVLADGRYVRWLQANRGTALLINSENDGSIATQHTRPDVDATYALVLTLRFFIQENEPSSFRWLAKHALTDAGVSGEWKQGFTRIRRQLNDWLDGPSDLTQQYELECVTREVPAMQEGRLRKYVIMRVFIYGDAAHVNQLHKQMFDRWKANPIWFEMAQLEFDHVLMGVLKAIWAVARLSEHELASTGAKQ